MTTRFRVYPKPCLFLLLLFASGDLAGGQPPLDRNAPQLRPQPFNAKGRVYSISPGWIRMVTDTQQPWVVQMDQRTQIQVRGEAGIELIVPGVYVRFEAALMGRRVAAGEITELALYSPMEGFSAGVMADPGPPDGQGQVDSATGKSAPNQPGPGTLKSNTQGRADRAKGDRATRQPGRARKRSTSAPEGNFLIAGQVRSFRKGSLVVLAGKAGSIKAKVAQQAKVTIDSTSYAMVRRGDTIHVIGSYVRPGQVRARKVEIEMASGGQTSDRNARAQQADRARRRTMPGQKPAEALDRRPLRDVPKPDR